MRHWSVLFFATSYRRATFLLIASLLLPPSAAAAVPQAGTLRVQVRSEGKPLEAADVVIRGVAHRTDADGAVSISVDAGPVTITVAKEGFLPATVTVQLAAGAQQDVVVDLQKPPDIEAHVTVVAATRTDKRLEDQPMRVEVLAREEIEEKMLMTPGDIVMMLNEMGGMRVQRAHSRHAGALHAGPLRRPAAVRRRRRAGPAVARSKVRALQRRGSRTANRSKRIGAMLVSSVSFC
jgi:hypothetical protein